MASKVGNEALADEIMGLMFQMRPPHHPDPQSFQRDNKCTPCPHPHSSLPRDLVELGRGSMGVLGILSHFGGEATPSQLVDFTHLSKGRISNIVRSLEEKDYVHKRPSTTDSRSVVVALTDKGKGVTEKHDAEMRESMIRVVEFLGPEDSQAAIRILSRLVEFRQEEGTCPEGSKL